MMICTIGFGRKSAEQFFHLLKNNRVELLVDVRLNNRSQLAGFTKDGDIQFFLREICGIDYVHALDLAPEKELLSHYQAKEITWTDYVDTFTKLMESRGTYRRFVSSFAKYHTVCLLCSEPTPEKCHRRLVAEMIARENPDTVRVIHL